VRASTILPTDGTYVTHGTNGPDLLVPNCPISHICRIGLIHSQRPARPCHADTPIRRYATSASESGSYSCMKITPLRSVTIALIAMAVISYPSITHAKPTPTPAPAVAATGGKQALTADQRLADLKKQVNLTKAQETKVKPIVEKYVADREAITNDKSLSKTDKNSKKDTLRTQYNQDINAVLTPDQQKKWGAAKKEIFAPAKQPAAASPTPAPKK